MTSRKVLITGARGQLGIALKASLPQQVRATAIDLQELDLTDSSATAAYVESLQPDWIINCAAYTAVDKAESETELAYRANRDAPLHLARAACGCGARIVQISTDFVFDGRKSSPYLPTDTPNPLGIYGRSKLEGELAVTDATKGDGLILRTAWLYSAHGNNFVKTMLRLMQERSELKVVADQVGTPTSADSLALAIWKLVEGDAPGGVHHYSDAGVASWYDFACAIRELAEPLLGRALCPVLPIRTQDYPTPAQRPAYSVLDKVDSYARLGVAAHWREPLRPVLATLAAPTPEGR